MIPRARGVAISPNLTGVEDLVAVGRLDLLGDLVLEVLDDERVRAVQHGEPVPRHPHRRQPRGALALGRVGRSASTVLALGRDKSGC